MKRKIFWIVVGVLLAVPLLPSIISLFGNFVRSLGSGKVDDWVYEGSSIGVNLLASWSQLGLGGKAITVGIVTLIVAYIGFPLYRFVQGLIVRENGPEYDDETNQYHTNEWRRHRLWLGAPAVWSVALLYGTWLMVSFSLHSYVIAFIDDNEAVVPWLLVLIAIVFVVLIAWLFFGGVYSWIRNHGDDIARRTGRNKFLFSLYYVVLLVPALVLLSLYSAQSVKLESASSASIARSPNAPAGALGNQMSARGGISESNTIGLAVGGAKDINNFRENINNEYLPTPSDITHEGVFYDYAFDTGLQEECAELFCPSYTTAVSRDPYSSSTEYFLSVGLNSGIRQEDFKRKKLNLVIVLDISGSMSSSFDRYYYDKFRTDTANVPEGEEVDNRSKMEIANESVVALLGHLNPEDRLGMVLFESNAYTAKGLRTTESSDMEAIKRHILKVTPTGGTNMEAGYKAGTELLQEFKDVDKNEYENRIIFLTDAMPNTGQVSEEGLFGMTKTNARDGIYTTFVGVGVDFNTELINEVTKTQGANYYSVHSAKEFTYRMDKGFTYMVTPLVFDLSLNLESVGYEIRSVYGSPEANLSSGELMKINTLFPSERIDGETKGGLVLLHLNKLNNDAQLKLGVSYKNRTGEVFVSKQDVRFDSANTVEYFANTGIHKGVVLSRYVNVMKDWLAHEAALAPKAQIEIPIVRYTEEGIPVTRLITELGRWERTSNTLALSDEYFPILTALKSYLATEVSSIGDTNMEQELKLLDTIISSHESPPATELSR